MTFSIVARGDDGSSWGVAVASKFLAVGAAVPAAEAGTGALATQSYANLTYRPEGLRMLREGHSAGATVDALTAPDARRDVRQLGVVDRHGRAASFTGSGCHPWAGGRTGRAYAAQGNILVGPEVLDAMETAWQGADSATPLATRLLAALAAGDTAGGDRRGRQSAALLVVSPDSGYGGGSDVLVDLRVDDHEAPVDELGRLLELHELYFGRPDPASLLRLDGALSQEVRDRLTGLGHAAGDLDAALASWAGIENLEERLVRGRIDPLVLGRLRRAHASRPPGESP
ncbi:MAG: DUF1028 domain-containing protein [Streptomycetales bacterium]